MKLKKLVFYRQGSKHVVPSDGQDTITNRPTIRSTTGTKPSECCSRQPFWFNAAWLIIIGLFTFVLVSVLSDEELPCPPGHYTFPSGACLICAAGYYGEGEPLLIKGAEFHFQNSTCDGPCEPGYYCPEGSSSAQQNICPKGSYCPSHAADPNDFKCPVGSYGSSEGLTTPECSGLCEAVPGKYCPEGSQSAQLVPCPPGSYCPGTIGVSSIRPCPQGRYGSSIGLTNEICDGECDIRHFCPAGSKSPTEMLCPLGFYCPSNNSTLAGQKVPCPAGTYGSKEGSITESEGCTTCPETRWCPEGSSNADLLCPPGYFCPRGTVNYTKNPCAAGYFCREGAKDPENYRCPKGYYCPTATGPSPIPCPPGTFGNEELLKRSNCSGLCNSGAICPALSQSPGPYPCPPGYFCPEGTGALDDGLPSDEYKCPGGIASDKFAVTQELGCYCNHTEAQREEKACECTQGHYCPAGSTKKNKFDCPEGYYCPDFASIPFPCNENGYWCPQRSVIPNQRLNSVKLSIFGLVRDVVLQDISSRHITMSPEVGSIGFLRAIPNSEKRPNFYFERGLSHIVVDLRVGGVMDFEVFVCHQGSYSDTYYDVRKISFVNDRAPNMTWTDVQVFPVPRNISTFDSYAFCAEYPWGDGTAVSFSETFSIVKGSQVAYLRSWVATVLAFLLPLQVFVILQPNRKVTSTKRVREVDTFIEQRAGSSNENDEIDDASSSETSEYESSQSSPWRLRFAKLTLLAEGAQLASILLSRLVPHAEHVGGVPLLHIVRMLCDVLGFNPILFLGQPVTLVLLLAIASICGALYNPMNLVRHYQSVFGTLVSRTSRKRKRRTRKQLYRLSNTTQHRNELLPSSTTIETTKNTDDDRSYSKKSRFKIWVWRWRPKLKISKFSNQAFTIDPSFKRQVLRPFAVEALYVPILVVALGAFDCAYNSHDDGWEYEFYDEVLLGYSPFNAINKLRLVCWYKAHLVVATISSVVFPWIIWGRIHYLVREKPLSSPPISSIPRYEFWVVVMQTVAVTLHCLSVQTGWPGLLLGIMLVWSFGMYFYQFTVQSLLGRFHYLNNHRAASNAILFTICVGGLSASVMNPISTVPLGTRSPQAIVGTVCSIPIVYLLVFKINSRRAFKFANAMKGRFYEALKDATGSELYRYMNSVPIVLRNENSPEFAEQLLVLLGEWTHSNDKLHHAVQIRKKRNEQERLAKLNHDLHFKPTATHELSNDMKNEDDEHAKNSDADILDEAIATAKHQAMLAVQRKQRESLRILCEIFEQIDEVFPKQAHVMAKSTAVTTTTKQRRTSLLTSIVSLPQTRGWAWIRKIIKLQQAAQLTPVNLIFTDTMKKVGTKKKRLSLIGNAGAFLTTQFQNPADENRYLKHIQAPSQKSESVDSNDETAKKLEGAKDAEVTTKKPSKNGSSKLSWISSFASRRHIQKRQVVKNFNPKDALKRLNTFRIPSKSQSSLDATPLAVHVATRSIKHIRWKDAGIDDTFLGWFSPILNFGDPTSGITSITLCHNNITRCGVIQLLKGVAISKSLNKVDLSHNEQFHCYSIPPKYIFSAFKGCTTLKSLKFGDTLSLKRVLVAENEGDLEELVVQVRCYETQPALNEPIAKLGKAQRKRQHLRNENTIEDEVTKGEGYSKVENSTVFNVLDPNFDKSDIPEFDFSFFESLQDYPKDSYPKLEALPFITVLTAYLHHTCSILSFELYEPERHMTVSKHTRSILDAAIARYRSLKTDVAHGLLLSAKEMKERAENDYRACCTGMILTDEWSISADEPIADLSQNPLSDFGIHDVVLASAAILLHAHLVEVKLPGQLIGAIGSELVSEAILRNNSIAVVCFDRTNIFTCALRGKPWHPKDVTVPVTLFGQLNNNTIEDQGEQSNTDNSQHKVENLVPPLLVRATQPSLIQYGPSELCDGDLAIMGRLVTTNDKLREVRIFGEKITQHGVGCLFKGLCQASSLAKLRKLVVGNWRTSCSIGLIGANYLANFLCLGEQLQSLVSLDLRNVNLGPEGCAVLCASSLQLQLESVKLSRNNIGDAGCKAVAKLLGWDDGMKLLDCRCQHSLRKLHLGSNSIGAHGIEVLSEAFARNSVIQTLFLDCNDIGDEGAMYLSSALRQNYSLKTLGLERSRIEADGAVLLAGSLFDEPLGTTTASNVEKETSQITADLTATKLDTLILCDNDIGDDGGRALARALLHNTTLTSMSLVRTGIREPAAILIADAIRGNAQSKINFMDFHGCRLIGTRGLEALQDAQQFAIRRAEEAIEKREESTKNRSRRVSALQAGLINDAVESSVVFGFPEL